MAQLKNQYISLIIIKELLFPERLFFFQNLPAFVATGFVKSWLAKNKYRSKRKILPAIVGYCQHDKNSFKNSCIVTTFIKEKRIPKGVLLMAAGKNY